MLVRGNSLTGSRDDGSLLVSHRYLVEGHSIVVSPLDPLPDISPDQPSGPNLEFDPDFAELERLAQGKPEQQFGSTVVPAEEPDWKAVIASANALSERSYDLRVMAHLSVARLNREGFVPFAAVLARMRQTLRLRWEDVHPQLDPEDDNDPTTRSNSLLLISQPGRVLRVLRTMPLARSARGGSVTWRDIAIASGTLDAPAEYTKMTDAVISGIFRESEPSALQAMRDAIASAVESAVDIPAVFNELAGHGTGPDYTELTRLLRDLGHIIDRHAPTASAVATEDAVAEPDAAEHEAIPVAASSTGGERAKPIMSIQTMGPPTNRADALRLLDLVMEFYQRNEPSSPLPLLIGRARRLAEMSFMDILRDLAPDGIMQAERIAGTDADT